MAHEEVELLSIEGEPIQGYDVYQWPEFIALADRLGIPLELRTVSISIMLTEDRVRIRQEYNCVDRAPFIDTTTLLNNKYRTSKPRKVDSPAERS